MSPKPAPNAPPDRVAAYERLVAAVPDVERKGATMPYTSVNGNMFSYLDASGSMALRLSESDRAVFMDRFATTLHHAYGIVQKDLRAALGRKVRGPLNRVYCGGGSLAACRSALEDSLRRAIAESPQQVYPADSACGAGDQMCFDSIQFRPIGVVTQPLIEWVNRPTFQQADEIQGHGPR